MPDLKDELFEMLERGIDPDAFRILEGDHDEAYVKSVKTGRTFRIRVDELEDENGG